MSIDFYTIAQSIISKIGIDITTNSIKYGSRSISEVLSSIKINLAKFLSDSYEKHSMVRTLLHRDISIPVLSIYTQTKFRSHQYLYRDTHLIKLVMKGAKFCVVGSGGCGKSMFMKFLVINTIENDKGKIPLFLELRNLNKLKSNDLIKFIHQSVVPDESITDTSYISNLLEKGKIILIFDGFDEIEYNDRIKIETQILRLSERYSKASIVVSSRPDDRFASWVNFQSLHVEPMAVSQTVSLISKLDYDKTVKRKFIERVKKDLYQKHKSFLSNPLLTTMMLLTYDQFAHIPDKIHLFYEQAFETLFFKHDSSKEAGYKRNNRSGAPINVFKECFSTFCILTYAKEKFSFTESDVLNFLTQALSIENKAIDAQLFLEDLLGAVCILQREGLYISFAHRSFQEYFAAYFISRGTAKNVPKLLNVLVRRKEDNVLPMAYDMNSSLIEREWVSQHLKEFISCLEAIDLKLQKGKYYRTIFGELNIRYEPDGDDKNFVEFEFLVNSPSQWTNFMFFLYRTYRNEFKDVFGLLTGRWDANGSIIEEMRNRDIFPSDGKPSYHPIQGPEYDPITIDFDDNRFIEGSELGHFPIAHLQTLSKLSKKISASVIEKENLIDDLI